MSDTTERLIGNDQATPSSLRPAAELADPGQDSYGAPDPTPLWTILDLTPGGRGTDWYPKLEYAP